MAAFGVKVLPVGGHPGMKFPESQVGAVAAEDLGGRHRPHASGLVWVAEEELACLDRPLVRVGAGVLQPPSTACLSHSVLKAQGRPSGR